MIHMPEVDIPLEQRYIRLYNGA